jgi:hypothetical protein
MMGAGQGQPPNTMVRQVIGPNQQLQPPQVQSSEPTTEQHNEK